MEDIFNEDLKEQKIQKRLLEADVQSACVDFARRRGFWARKFSSPSNRSVPDYLFGKKYPHRTVKWAEEFKAPGKDATGAQLDEQQIMRDAGWTVFRNTGTKGNEDIALFKRRIMDMENGIFAHPY